MESRFRLLLLLLIIGGSSALKIDISKTSTSSPPTTITTPVADDQSTTTVSPENSIPTSTTQLPKDADSVTLSTSTSNGQQATTTTVVTTSTTTPRPTVNDTQEDVANSQTVNSRTSPRNYFCECDLQINLCDTNCCCDIDCTANAIRSFDCTKGGIVRQPSYLSGYGLPPCSVSSSWFCVVNVDFQSSSVIHWTFDNAKREPRKWPDRFPAQGASSLGGQQSDTYRFNDAVLLFNDATENLDMINLPSSVYGPDCHFSEGVRFMMNHRSSCKGLDPIWLEPYLRNVSNWRVLSDTRFKSDMMSEHCAELGTDFCIPLIVQVCDPQLNCTTVNDTQVDTVKPVWVKLQFTHNFTNILAVSMILREGNNFTEANDFVADFEVEFTAETQNNSFIYKASGNVGYESRQPVIISEIPIVNVSEFNQEFRRLDFFHPRINRSSIFTLPTPDSNDGHCSMNGEPLNFNENSLTQCTLPFSEGLSLDRNDNFTENCRNYQLKIFQLIYKNSTIQFERLFVSQFGNPKNDTKHWKRVDVSPVFDMTKIVGNRQDDNFQCQNMILEYSLNIFYSKQNDATSGAVYQSLIQGLRIDLGTPLDLQFNLQEDIQVPITIKVRFVDLTTYSGSGSGHFQSNWMWLGMALLIGFVSRECL